RRASRSAAVGTTGSPALSCNTLPVRRSSVIPATNCASSPPACGWGGFTRSARAASWRATSPCRLPARTENARQNPHGPVKPPGRIPENWNGSAAVQANRREGAELGPRLASMGQELTDGWQQQEPSYHQRGRAQRDPPRQLPPVVRL